MVTDEDYHNAVFASEHVEIEHPLVREDKIFKRQAFLDALRESISSTRIGKLEYRHDDEINIEEGKCDIFYHHPPRLVSDGSSQRDNFTVFATRLVFGYGMRVSGREEPLLTIPDLVAFLEDHEDESHMREYGDCPELSIYAASPEYKFLTLSGNGDIPIGDETLGKVVEEIFDANREIRAFSNQAEKGRQKNLSAFYLRYADTLVNFWSKRRNTYLAKLNGHMGEFNPDFLEQYSRAASF